MSLCHPVGADEQTHELYVGEIQATYEYRPTPPLFHASISRLLKIIGLFCKRTLYKRRYSAKATDGSDI